MEALFRRDWRYVSARIREKEALSEAPPALTRVSKVLCQRSTGATYDCAAITHYTLASGRQGSALVVDRVGRDEQGRLVQVLVSVELPYSR